MTFTTVRFKFRCPSKPRGSWFKSCQSQFSPLFHQLLKFYSTAETITVVAKAQLAKAKRKARGADFSFHSFSWLFNYFLNGFWFLSSFCYFLRITFLGRFAWNVWRQLQTSAWKSKWWQLYSSTTLALATTISVGRKKAQHQEVFPWGDNCFLMIFSKPNKSLEWFCGLTAFDIPRVLLHFWESFLWPFCTMKDTWQ